MVEIADRNIKRDYLRRWWCKKYSLPPNDYRFLSYSLESLLIEFLEDAIDDEIIDPENIEAMSNVRRRMYRGTEIYETGSKIFDAEERRWAEQKSLDYYIKKYEAGELSVDGPTNDVGTDEVDLLDKWKGEV